jgi:hypothetical protein
MVALLGSVTSKAVSALAIKANTSLLSPLNGVKSFKASLIEIYSVILAVLLSVFTTSVCKVGYRLGMD